MYNSVAAREVPLKESVGLVRVHWYPVIGEMARRWSAQRHRSALSCREVPRLVLPNKSTNVPRVRWHPLVGRCYDAGSGLGGTSTLASKVVIPLNRFTYGCAGIVLGECQAGKLLMQDGYVAIH